MEITPRKVAPSQMKVVWRSGKDRRYIPGRRAEIKYEDLGLAEASGGDTRAEIMTIGGKMAQPSGWHYHTADVQFLHLMEGWLKMEFEDLGVIVMEAGDSITIPGGVIHQELCCSNPGKSIEVTIPAKFATINVETPSWAREKGEDYGELSAPLEVV